MPIVAARCFVSGKSSTCFTASVSWEITGAGVPAGANKPTHASSSKPGRPASATVGTSGSIGWRVLPVTAKAFSLPCCT